MYIYIIISKYYIWMIHYFEGFFCGITPIPPYTKCHESGSLRRAKTYIKLQLLPHSVLKSEVDFEFVFFFSVMFTHPTLSHTQ